MIIIIMIIIIIIIITESERERNRELIQTNYRQETFTTTELSEDAMFRSAYRSIECSPVKPADPGQDSFSSPRSLKKTFFTLLEFSLRDGVLWRVVSRLSTLDTDDLSWLAWPHHWRCRLTDQDVKEPLRTTWSSLAVTTLSVLIVVSGAVHNELSV